jgi:Organic solute transporter Ostalpha
MGQPVRKTYMTKDGETITSTNSPTSTSIPTTKTLATETIDTSLHSEPMGTYENIAGRPVTTNGISTTSNSQRKKPLKRVHWTSPFFVKCKFGVIQYVLLKLVCSLAIFVLEKFEVYNEGNFTYKGGYLYVCILTNLSQCWALYCLIFFYYATKNECKFK